MVKLMAQDKPLSKKIEEILNAYEKKLAEAYHDKTFALRISPKKEILALFESERLKAVIPDKIVAFLEVEKGDKLAWKMETIREQSFALVWKTPV